MCVRVCFWFCLWFLAMFVVVVVRTVSFCFVDMWCILEADKWWSNIKQPTLLPCLPWCLCRPGHTHFDTLNLNERHSNISGISHCLEPYLHLTVNIKTEVFSAAVRERVSASKVSLCHVFLVSLWKKDVKYQTRVEHPLWKK